MGKIDGKKKRKCEYNAREEATYNSVEIENTTNEIEIILAERFIP